MKRILNLFLIILVLLLPINAEGADNILLSINQEAVPFSVEMGYPYISHQNRTMVPIRVISENMDYEVAWNKDTKTVSIYDEESNISFQIGSSEALVNGVIVAMDIQNGMLVDTKAEISNGRTYVPIRFITESMGGQIEYEKTDNTHKINISKDREKLFKPSPKPQPIEPAKEYAFPEITTASVYFDGKVLSIKDHGNNDIFMVEKDGIKNYYNINRPLEQVPLLFGSGLYTIGIFENIEGAAYKVKAKVSKNIELSENYNPFLLSGQPLYWGDLERKISNHIVAGANTDDEKVRLIHKFVTESITYDYVLAQEAESFYYPENKRTLEKGSGICYDYASLFGGLLRAQGIPTKLVKGYRVEDKDQYHAWNEVYVDGQWKNVDTTFDAVIFNSKVYTPSNKFTIINSIH